MKLNDTQLSQVDAQIKRLVKTDSYYGKKYRELGITDVTSQEAFEELPFSSKDDLRNAYPLGIQAVPDEEVVRIHLQEQQESRSSYLTQQRMSMIGQSCSQDATRQPE